MSSGNEFLKTVHFDHPERVITRFSINPSCWHVYPPEELHALQCRHPMLFPGVDPSAPPKIPASGVNGRVGKPYRDYWGCVWTTAIEGMTGCITEHALADWADFEDYTPPDPTVSDGVRPVNWDGVRAHAERTRAIGGSFGGSLTHGHTYLRLEYLRGYENLLFDMVEDNPQLWRLIEIVEAFNTETVSRYLDLGAEWFGFPEDLGMQVGPMLMPEHFRRFIKPSFQRLMGLVRDRGAAVHMHSDGDIRSLLDDLIDGGVQCINLQDLVNGIDWIRDNLKGRVCI
ncbi:MAG: hypothetical protein KAI66_08825, partial [Lentisphaeria bacterium]|nr:hypothetical protein [Lentisphaeria bacterium]